MTTGWRAIRSCPRYYFAGTEIDGPKGCRVPYQALAGQLCPRLRNVLLSHEVVDAFVEMVSGVPTSRDLDLRGILDRWVPSGRRSSYDTTHMGDGLPFAEWRLDTGPLGQDRVRSRSLVTLAERGAGSLREDGVVVGTLGCPHLVVSETEASYIGAVIGRMHDIVEDLVV